MILVDYGQVFEIWKITNEAEKHAEHHEYSIKTPLGAYSVDLEGVTLAIATIPSLDEETFNNLIIIVADNLDDIKSDKQTLHVKIADETVYTALIDNVAITRTTFYPDALRTFW